MWLKFRNFASDWIGVWFILLLMFVMFYLAVKDSIRTHREDMAMCKFEFDSAYNHADSASLIDAKPYCKELLVQNAR